MVDPAYPALIVHLRQLSALRKVARLLTWDQETQMPPRGAAARAAHAGAVAAAIHALATDPRIPEWIAAAEPEGEAARVNLAEAARLHRRATLVPAALAAELAEATVVTQTTWEAAREASDFARFAPELARVLRLKREEAACLGGGYDALIDEFEPGMTAARSPPYSSGSGQGWWRSGRASPKFRGRPRGSRGISRATGSSRWHGGWARSSATTGRPGGSTLRCTPRAPGSASATCASPPGSTRPTRGSASIR